MKIETMQERALQEAETAKKARLAVVKLDVVDYSAVVALHAVEAAWCLGRHNEGNRVPLLWMPYRGVRDTARPNGKRSGSKTANRYDQRRYGTYLRS